MKEVGADLLIIPRNPSKEIFHKEAESLLSDALWLPLVNPKMVAITLISLVIKPHLWKVLVSIIYFSRTWHILAKNLAVVPKGVYLTHFLKNQGIKHIHAHWGSTTSTMAYAISQITGIPWSFTLHRWDIKENNMLKEKVRSAKFVRCISEHGKNELLKIIGKRYEEKIKVVHMGLMVPVNDGKLQKRRKFFTIIIPANLLEVKGHQYLIEACAILIKSEIKNFQCIFYGEGPLRTKLERIVKERKLTNYIEMPGAIPHEKLIAMYKNHEVDLVILPSITTNKGAHEGIPVSLMEAMAYGIPVISTNTGGIPELVNDKSGIMVEEKNAKDIANALEKFIRDEKFGNKIGKKGMLRVKKDFNIETNIKSLIKLFSR